MGVGAVDVVGASEVPQGRAELQLGRDWPAYAATRLGARGRLEIILDRIEDHVECRPAHAVARAELARGHLVHLPDGCLAVPPLVLLAPRLGLRLRRRIGHDAADVDGACELDLLARDRALVLELLGRCAQPLNERTRLGAAQHEVAGGGGAHRDGGHRVHLVGQEQLDVLALGRAAHVGRLHLRVDLSRVEELGEGDVHHDLVARLVDLERPLAHVHLDHRPVLLEEPPRPVGLDAEQVVVLALSRPPRLLHLELALSRLERVERPCLGAPLARVAIVGLLRAPPAHRFVVARVGGGVGGERALERLELLHGFDALGAGHVSPVKLGELRQ
mmetsp:Transcript_24146/g.57284  ORF Transcript_24146/g.57284 Transcript_24146/m.57284 type:complete len:332 (-) Transcript_24146:472-1467(-)